MSDSNAFKNYYDSGLARKIGKAVAGVYPQFDSDQFVTRIEAQVGELEFKDRIRLFTIALHEQLPASFPDAWAVLKKLIPRGPGEVAAEPGASDRLLDDGYALWPLAQYIEEYGLDDFDASMEAMHAITQRHTAEFAIRPFLTRYPKQTLAILARWVRDPSEHVRRLVSEGTRTRLPWAARLYQFIEEPSPTIGLIENLKDDPSEYVRRSVANHLNDIGKDHPDLLIDVTTRWQRGASSERQRLIRHALRSLVKKGDSAALNLLGFGPPKVALSGLCVESHRITMGESIDFSFTLRSEAERPQRLVIDYLIHFVKSNGTTSPKVFKLTTRDLGPGESTQIRRKHAIRPITTRRYHSGEHRLEVQVNGQVLGGTDFVLDAE